LYLRIEFIESIEFVEFVEFVELGYRKDQGSKLMDS